MPPGWLGRPGVCVPSSQTPAHRLGLMAPPATAGHPVPATKLCGQQIASRRRVLLGSIGRIRSCSCSGCAYATRILETRQRPQSGVTAGFHMARVAACALQLGSTVLECTAAGAWAQGRAPATRASNTRQRPSLDAVASSAPAGCHATATTLLPWQRRISLAAHQSLRASLYATLTQRAALPMANLRPHGLQRTHSAASSSRVTTCVPLRPGKQNQQ